jgi:hypothetical protein
MPNWITNIDIGGISQYILGLISGGVIWEGIKVIQPQISRFIKERKEVRQLLNANVEPLLRSSNELLAKISDYAKTDFTDLTKVSVQNDTISQTEFAHNKFLFATFYGHISLFRNKASYLSLSTSKKGVSLLRFIRTFESRRNRLFPKSVQKVIGDTMINENGLISFSDFLIRADHDPLLTKWLMPLQDLLVGNDSDHRQRILIMGIIIMAFLDHFDKDNKIGRERRIYKNKLTKKSRQALKYRVFPEYLSFIKNPQRYY